MNEVKFFWHFTLDILNALNCWISMIQRMYTHGTKGEWRVYTLGTKGVRRVYEGCTAGVRRVYEGWTESVHPWYEECTSMVQRMNFGK